MCGPDERLTLAWHRLTKAMALLSVRLRGRAFSGLKGVRARFSTRAISVSSFSPSRMR